MFLTKLRTIGTAAETTPGTPIAVSGLRNNVRAWDLAIGSITVEPDANPSKYATGDFGLGESIPGNQSASISFNTKFWSEASGVEPAWTKFAKAAGCAVTEVDGDFDVYPSKDTVEDAITIGIFDIAGQNAASGLHYEFTGAIGNCTVSTEGTGKPYTMGWEFTGALNDIKDIAVTDVPVYSGSVLIPDRFLAGSGVIGTHTVCISTMSFGFGNAVTPVQCQNSDSGYKQFVITNMEPTLTINPLLESNADYDFWSKWTEGTIEAVTIETEQFKFYAPRCQITTANVEDSDGVLRTTLELRPLRPSTEGDYSYAPWVMTIKSRE